MDHWWNEADVDSREIDPVVYQQLQNSFISIRAEEHAAGSRVYNAPVMQGIEVIMLPF